MWLYKSCTDTRRHTARSHVCVSCLCFQTKSTSRAMELGAMSRGNDDRVSELEKEKNTLLNELSDLKAKVSISSSEADGLKDQLKEMKVR